METTKEVPYSGRGTRNIDWPDLLRQVDALAPGEWGSVGTFNRSVVTKIRRGEYPSVDPEVYEVTSAKNPNGTSTLWMRRKRGA